MAEKLTPQQEMAVKNRGGKLLVSAAAGSGKTKVLVDRLLSYLMDPMQPANLDEFLIITYTTAAASELRGKIAAKLTEKIAEDPENRHLQRQMQRLYLTKISTVHSFCTEILREYAFAVDLSADFRVADENECRELRERCMGKLLDEAYQNPEDASFRAFVDTQGLGRDDRLVPEILLKVYDSARCHLDPEKWLSDCVENARTEDIADAAQTVWGKYLMADLMDYLGMQIDAMERCANAAAEAEEMEKPAALLAGEVLQLRHLQESTTWDEVVQNKDITYGTLRFSKKCPDMDLAERIKAVRNGCKTGLAKRLRTFADPSAVVMEEMGKCSLAVEGMVNLVRKFDAEYQKLKRSRRVLDFGDLEHRCLDLLLGKSRSGPTAAANEIGRRFREIMVDEYQDSNAVQDAIFSALTVKKQNCFMVGDVKQSIYQFRLADPGIFLEKYATFVPAETAKPMEGRKVMLSRNFRSGGDVLKAVNDVFRRCMSPKVGGLIYGEDEELREGIPHTPLGEPEVELWALEVRESAYDEEAAFVAKRIAQLLDGTHMVRNGESLRPIVPDDIAILLRSPGSSGSYFKEALESRGIRCTTGGGDDLLQTEEIMALRSLLQTISNPRQDIPLVAALSSPVFCFTADDLAVIRSAQRQGSFYDALLLSDAPKVQAFLEKLNALRRAARMEPLAQLIERIFSETYMDNIYAAMEGGEVKAANLQTFYQLAVDFETTGRRDLEAFLDFLTAMEDKGLVSAAQQTVNGAVTIMSIHKSKGLEFPVVFVSGLARAFNRESTRAQVLCDQELGLGLSAVDEKNRVRFPTIAKRAIAAKISADSLSEEMRVLYVALTRARDRLIMTYAPRGLDKELTNMVHGMNAGADRLLIQDVSCPGEWIIMTALGHTEAGELFALGGKPEHTELGDPVWQIGVTEAPAEVSQTALETEEKFMPEGTEEALRQSLEFRYPYEAAVTAPSKQTATQRKGREKDEEAAENAGNFPKRKPGWRRPSFVEKKTGGTDFGNAMHLLMQYIRFENCRTEDETRQEIRRLREAGFLTEEQEKIADSVAIYRLMQTPMGQKLQHGGNILREFKFSVLDDGENFNPDLKGEKILLQGVVDCALVEEDGITILDYKTDFVTEETLPERAEFYKPQVRAYAEAMSRIYQKPIKETLLYFFRLNRFVTV